MPKSFSIRLQIADFVCRLEVKNPNWENYFKEKFGKFLKPEGKTEIEFLISPEARCKDVSLRFSKGSSGAIIYCPDSLRFFKRVNFYLKVGVANFLLTRGHFLIHASSFEYKNRGYLFSGKQSAGKSTIIKLCQPLPGVTSLNDDFSLVKKVGSSYTVFSTPFYETNPIDKEPRKAIVNGVYFLIQSKRNHLKRLEVSQSAIRLSSHILSSLNMPDLKERQRKKMLELVWLVAVRAARKILCYNLFFKEDISFLKLIR